MEDRRRGGPLRCQIQMTIPVRRGEISSYDEFMGGGVRDRLPPHNRPHKEVRA